MNILREGAEELGLRQDYQDFLSNHPVQQTPTLLRKLAISNVVFTFTLSQKLGGWRGFSKLQQRLLCAVYVPSTPTQSKLKLGLSNLIMGCVLSPGACIGATVNFYYNRFVPEDKRPPFLKRMLNMLEEKKQDGENKVEEEEAEQSKKGMATEGSANGENNAEARKEEAVDAKDAVDNSGYEKKQRAAAS